MISAVRFGCGGMTPRFSAQSPAKPASQQPKPQPTSSSTPGSNRPAGITVSTRKIFRA